MVQSRRPGDPAGVAGPALTGPGADNNLWTQIGLMLLIALAAKNAILIARVTHGRWLRHEMPILDAAVGAARAWFAADPDDVVRAHPGRGAAGAGHDRGRFEGSHVWRLLGNRRWRVWRFLSLSEISCPVLRWVKHRSSVRIVEGVSRNAETGS